MYPKLKEECGIFGVYNPPKNKEVVNFALHALQHRGQDACGAAAWKNNKIEYFKDIGLVSEVFSIKENINKIKNSDIKIGHVRYATTGINERINAHPFVFDEKGYKLAIVHNGNLVNASSIREELEEEGIKITSTSDTELIGHLFLLSKKKTTLEKIKEVCNKIEGAFSLLIIVNGKLYAIRDKFAIRPFVMGIDKTSYYFASELPALTINGISLHREIKPAEIVVIDENGMNSFSYTNDAKMLPCSMEYIYFSRPDNVINGIVVQEFRKETGNKLAELFPVEADLIIPVPDSAISCALGFSETSKIPLEFGLIKNRYIARSFIAPSQSERERMVMAKLMASQHILKNKKIILIDDSIVRGTTIKTIIKLLKEAGTKEIHLRIGAPEFKFPAVYGIDVSSKEELISNKMNKKELQKHLGVDSLEFLPVQTLSDILNHETLLTYFDGIYPTKNKGKIYE